MRGSARAQKGPDLMQDTGTLADRDIVERLLSRDETALEALGAKYGRLYRSLAVRLTGSDADAEECLNEALLRIWDSVPPERPGDLRAYGARIVRNLAVDAVRRRCADRRGGSELVDELRDAVPAGGGADVVSDSALSDLIDRFLRSCDSRTRTVFVLRYWHGLGEDEIAGRTGLRRPGVHTSLARTKKRLRDYLEKEGVSL